MLSTPIYHRTHPYSERELYQVIMAFLKDNFVFRRLEIDAWLSNNRIIFRQKDEKIETELCSGKNAEELWYDGAFEEWHAYSAATVNYVSSEFLFKNARAVGMNRKRLVKEIIRAEIEKGILTETVKFNPVLKQLIEQGRIKVTGVKPLLYGNHQRKPVELNEGDICYFCWHTKSPYMANPAFVFKKFESSYIIIFFSNQYNGSETGKPQINMGRFIHPQADELGLTPEQAVLQRYC